MLLFAINIIIINLEISTQHLGPIAISVLNLKPPRSMQRQRKHHYDHEKNQSLVVHFFLLFFIQYIFEIIHFSKEQIRLCFLCIDYFGKNLYFCQNEAD